MEKMHSRTDVKGGDKPSNATDICRPVLVICCAKSIRISYLTTASPVTRNDTSNVSQLIPTVVSNES
jgi:hypothetical protein